MKKFLFTLGFVVCFGALTSCSVDEIDENNTTQVSENTTLNNSASVSGKDGDEEIPPVVTVDPIVKPKQD
ncbi:hypothetical protein [Flavobacterium humi]|uniref:Uncharacterized protein n=1 Tax=Flavobacterium humi TaxID=2562683 RepID=A0A4Z0LB85_9FLAO|nr:hypothetical protein [Flavobacterium humi]TGD58545.1 hypothetical protein E4635_06430 [Flavobacterium humi]